MTYDHRQVYDCIRKLQAAVEQHERDSKVCRVDVAELQRRVQQLEEKLAIEKAANANKDKLLHQRLKTIEELQLQRDSLRMKNSELVERLAASGRRMSSTNSPLLSSIRNSYSSSEDTISTTASEPGTPIKHPLPPITVITMPTSPDSDTDMEEMEDQTSAKGLDAAIKDPRVTLTVTHANGVGTADPYIIPPTVSSNSPKRRALHKHFPAASIPAGGAPLSSRQHRTFNASSSGSTTTPPGSSTPGGSLYLTNGASSSSAQEQGLDTKYGHGGKDWKELWKRGAGLVLVYPKKQASGEEALKQMSGEEASKPVLGDEVPKRASHAGQASGEEAPWDGIPKTEEDGTKREPVEVNAKPGLEFGDETLKPRIPVEARSGERHPVHAPDSQGQSVFTPQVPQGKSHDPAPTPQASSGTSHDSASNTSTASASGEQEADSQQDSANKSLLDRCNSAGALMPTQTKDDIALATIGENDHTDGGTLEMRNRTNTFSPSSKQMVGRRTPKKVKKMQQKAAALRRETSTTSSSSVLKYLSPDMEARIYEKICRSLGKKYGSLERATQAAVTIQKAYRGYKLRKHFDEIRKEGPMAIRQRMATVRDKNRKLSFKSRPLHRDKMASVQDKVDKISNKRNSLGRTRVSRKKLVCDSEVPHPLPPPLDPNDLPLQDSKEASVMGPDHVGEEKSPTGKGGAEGKAKAVGEVGPNSGALAVTVSVACSDESSTQDMDNSDFRMPKSQSVDLSRLQRISMFSLHSNTNVDSSDGKGGWLKTNLRASMVKKRINIGVYQFNRKPTSGIQYLVTAGILPDSPQSVAKFLKERYGLSKLKIGEFLGEIQSEFNMAVLEHLAESMDMKDKPIDVALREFQTLFRMPGEAHKMDRIMQVFAAEYVKVNKGVFETEDAAYMLSFSIMMLYTSLHNPSVKKRTTKEQWLMMTRALNNNTDFPRQMLLDIYFRIQKTQFVTAEDHTKKVMEIQQKLEGSDIWDLVAPHRCFIDEVVIYEMDDINHWYTKHRRNLLIFNDLVIVTKKNRKHKFLFRNSFSLFNSIVIPFQSTQKHGLQVYDAFDRKVLLQCTCKSPEESTILMKKLNDAITMLRELEKDRIEVLGSFYGSTDLPAAAKSMEDLSRFPSYLKDTSEGAGWIPLTRSLTLRPAAQTLLRPSRSNWTTFTKVPLRATKSSLPDNDRVKKTGELTKSVSLNKRNFRLKRNKTNKKLNNATSMEAAVHASSKGAGSLGRRNSLDSSFDCNIPDAIKDVCCDMYTIRLSENGYIHKDDRHDFSIDFPSGILLPNQSITLTIGVMMYGPFLFPEGLRPISPILWIFGDTDVDLKLLKDAKVILPHYLDIEEQDGKEFEILFMKAPINHYYNKKQKYIFESKANATLLNDRKAAFSTNHFCSLCLAAKVSESIKEKLEYCMTVFIDTINRMYTFVVSYCLKTCTETLKKHFNPVNKKTNFNFKSTSSSLTIVCSDVPQWILSLIKGNKIELTDLDIWNADIDILKWKENEGLYFPSFILQFDPANASTQSSKVLISFPEITRQIDLPLLVTTPSSIVAASSVSSNTVSIQEPELNLMTLLAFPGKSRTFSVAKEVGGNYFTFGVLLLNDTVGTATRALEDQYQRNAERINHEILIHWLQGKGAQPVAWSTLIGVLRKISLHQLADEMENCV